jgi:hypothetical protein
LSHVELSGWGHFKEWVWVKKTVAVAKNTLNSGLCPGLPSPYCPHKSAYIR